MKLAIIVILSSVFLCRLVVAAPGNGIAVPSKFTEKMGWRFTISNDLQSELSGFNGFAEHLLINSWLKAKLQTNPNKPIQPTADALAD